MVKESRQEAAKRRSRAIHPSGLPGNADAIRTALDETAPTPLPPITNNPFVIQYMDGSLAARMEREISYMYDMADCDAMEDVRAIWATGGTDDRLQPVHVGPQSRINTDEEDPFYYATAPLLTDDDTIVGYVTFTDH